MKKRIIAALLLVSKMLTLLAGCSAPKNSEQASKQNDNKSFQDEILESTVDNVIETFEVPSVDYSSEGLSIQREEIIVDEYTGNNLAVIRYLKDSTGNITSADIYSHNLSTRIEGVDIEKAVADTLEPLLEGHQYITNGYIGGSSLISYTLYQPTDDYPIAKCVYGYSNGELVETTYYDNSGNLIWTINKQDSGVDNPNEQETMPVEQTFYQTSKTGCNYAKKYINGNLERIEFYGRDDKTKDYIIISGFATDVVITDDNGLLQVKTTSDLDDLVYTIDNYGQIIFEKSTNYRPGTDKKEEISISTIKLQKEEQISGGNPEEELYITIKYFTGTTKTDSSTTSMPIKTEITSNYLDNPLIISYELNENGNLIPRDNQLKKDGDLTDMQMFVDPKDEIQHYIIAIEKEYIIATGYENGEFNTQTTTYRYSQDGRLLNDDEKVTSSSYSYQKPEYVLTLRPTP